MVACLHKAIEEVEADVGPVDQMFGYDNQIITGIATGVPAHS